MALIEIKDFSFRYKTSNQEVLHNINLTIEEGSFVVVCGLTGSGKTTLLTQLKPQIRGIGERQGDILYKGIPIEMANENDLVTDIGILCQDPDNQFVMENVLHELAFGLENLGYSSSEMQKQIGEMVSFFGFNKLLYKSAQELSGGEKQMVNLASVLVLRSKVLILDEPLSQLDPVMAENFLHMLRRINEELGITIIISEHRLELLLAMADQVVILEDGSVKMVGTGKEVCKALYLQENYKYFIPSVTRFYLDYENEDVPLTVKETKAWARKQKWSYRPMIEKEESPKEILNCKEVYFAYHKHEEDVLRNINFTIRRGEYSMLVGANGCGKSTLLKLIAGIYKPQRGKVTLEGKTFKQYGEKAWVSYIGYLGQNPKLYFNKATVEQVIEEAKGYISGINETYIEELLDVFKLRNKLKQHPYDLSGGEQQKLALITVLMKQPKLLLLDEPTKGMDPYSKEEFAKHLLYLNQKGVTILMVTHDLEFAALHGKQGMMLFDGSITEHMPIRKLLGENFFYTTAIGKVMRDVINQPIVCKQEVQRDA